MTVLKAIKEGKQTRAELNEILKQYYVRYHQDVEWSYAVINTMRSGLMSRLNDLDLIKREKLGKNVRYHITTEVPILLNMLESKTNNHPQQE
jgi:predicted transcriptional regulator